MEQENVNTVDIDALLQQMTDITAKLASQVEQLEKRLVTAEGKIADGEQFAAAVAEKLVEMSEAIAKQDAAIGIEHGHLQNLANVVAGLRHTLEKIFTPAPTEKRILN